MFDDVTKGFLGNSEQAQSRVLRDLNGGFALGEMNFHIVFVTKILTKAMEGR